MRIPERTDRNDSAATLPQREKPAGRDRRHPLPRPQIGKLPKFARGNGFQTELRRRVEAYFRNSGRRQRDCPQMYLKTGIVFAWLAISYFLLVFRADTWWLAVPLAISLSLAMAAVGFNVQHDGGHNAYSNRPWVNRLMALTLDLIGGSSYVWRWKHNVLHHTYVNITGYDSDIDLGFLGRLTPHQRQYGFQRFQHWYMWPLFGLVTIKWHLVTDFRNILLGRIGSYRFPRPRGWDLVAFIVGKTAFFCLAFVIPLLMHPIWSVLLLYAAVSFLEGVVLSVVFQLAHCVEEAAFTLPEGDTCRIENAFAVHQVQSTVDFARHSRLAAWLLGGLNFQIEHHLFPHICHINYPALSPLVEGTCQEFGVKYAEHDSIGAGIASHYRWLRRMGKPERSS